MTPTYPPFNGQSYASDATAAQIHALLKQPALIARRLSELLNQTLLADYLLTQRIDAPGGVVLFQQGRPSTTSEAEPVTAGTSYPMATTTEVDIRAASTSKWGLGTELTDEAISRMRMQPVDAAFQILAHELAKRTDLAAVTAINTATSGRTLAAGPWTDADAIVSTILTAQADADADEDGIRYSTLLCTPTKYVDVIGKLIASDVLPRESGNPLLSGASFPSILGVTIVSSPRAGSDPLLVDRAKLGAIATEKLGGGYSAESGIPGLEAKSFRLDERDSWMVQCRRVSVPIVLDPAGALHLTGTATT